MSVRTPALKQRVTSSSKTPTGNNAITQQQSGSARTEAPQACSTGGHGDDNRCMHDGSIWCLLQRKLAMRKAADDNDPAVAYSSSGNLRFAIRCQNTLSRLPQQCTV